MQRSLQFSYYSLRAQCMIATSNCVPCHGVSKQSLHSVIVISGTMKVSLSLISRGRMLRLMVLTLYFDLYYSGYHKNLIQQLCAPLCELSVCGRCVRWHTNIYKARRVTLFFSYGGPPPFHPYLSGEPRLSQQHRSLTFSDKTITSCLSIDRSFVDPACGTIIFLSLGCLWQSPFFSSYFNMFFFVLFKEYSWLLDDSWKINGVDQICPSGSYNIMSFMAAI